MPRCDAGQAAIRGWWELQVRPGEASRVAVAAKMDNGLPLMIERRLGAGRVMLWAISGQLGQTNWPKLESFLPIVHELTYHLAETGGSDNVPCGSSIAFELLRKAERGKEAAGGTVVVTTPSGRKLPVGAVATARGLSVRLATADEPGSYAFRLPKALADTHEMPTPKSDQVRIAAVPSPGEPDMKRLGRAELKTVGRNVDLYLAQSDTDLFTAAAGMVPGQELWRHLIWVALAVLVAEVGLARWIARDRQSHSATKVEFSADAIDLGTFRAQIASKQAAQKAGVR